MHRASTGTVNYGYIAGRCREYWLGGFNSVRNNDVLSEEKYDVSNNHNNSKYELRFIMDQSFELTQSQMFPLYQLKSKIASFTKEILKHNTSHEYNLSNVESHIMSITTGTLFIQKKKKWVWSAMTTRRDGVGGGALVRHDNQSINQKRSSNSK